MVDASTHLVELVPNKSARTVARAFFERVDMPKHEVPAIHISDNGGEFKDCFDELLRLYGAFVRVAQPCLCHLDIPASAWLRALIERFIDSVKR